MYTANTPSPILIRLDAIEAVRTISRELTDCKLACVKASPEETEILNEHIKILIELLDQTQRTLGHAVL